MPLRIMVSRHSVFCVLERRSVAAQYLVQGKQRGESPLPVYFARIKGGIARRLPDEEVCLAVL